ncbi:YceI family protein [Aequorivita viscosa]|uniref:YceI-like domain-containing protein n=1 Tax=Aequorivita viscosa TaxID=797419 RepID=A0A1M6FEE5_9FLAO|nr:YceI family protein [Aequorivita viscosa]SDW67915.1 YceI-like domain-containing protein [Aequorivita viscosa]SHI96061.1 YceI-like domain-containing protein [Aequorivita viscosa]
MKTLKQLKLVFGSLIMMVFALQISQAQTYQLSNTTSKLVVDGTSNIHDWQINAENQQGKLSAIFVDGQLTKIQKLDFSVTAESLKSGKSGMDKNTYKALNTSKYKQIVFKLTKVNSINSSGSNSYKVAASGNLMIAGVTKPIDITFELKTDGSKVTLSGSKTIKMTDFGVDPPKAMFGTITTGDAIDIKFESNFTK